MQIVKQGNVPLRPGVHRLIAEAVANGVPVAVCSTSNERSMREIGNMLPKDLSLVISLFAGDVVKLKRSSA